MRQLNRQQGVESQGAVLPEELLPQRPETATIQALPPQSAPRAPAGPSPAELSRAAAFQRATTQAVAAQAQRQDQQQKQSMAERAAGLEQQAENVRRNFSRLVDAFDTAHGFEDVIGLLMTFADLNIRLLMTLFDRKSKIFPKNTRNLNLLLKKFVNSLALKKPYWKHKQSLIQKQMLK
jgi:hypothetical protein